MTSTIGAADDLPSIGFDNLSGREPLDPAATVERRVSDDETGHYTALATERDFVLPVYCEEMDETHPTGAIQPLPSLAVTDIV